MRELPDPSKGQGIADIINDECPTLGRNERMRVLPKSIRAATLFINEACLRFVFADDRGPAKRDAVDADGVLDFSSRFHHNRCGRSNDKAERVRRNLCEIFWLSKEREHF